MSYVCEPCGGANPVTHLLTRLEGGKTEAVCNTDFPLVLIGNLATWLEADPQALYDHIQKFTAELDAAEAEPEPDQDETGATPTADPPAAKPRRARAAAGAEQT